MINLPLPPGNIPNNPMPPPMPELSVNQLSGINSRSKNIEEIDVTRTSKLAAMKIAAAINNAMATNLRPPPKLDMVEWADTYRHLPDNSAEPGLWKTSRVEVGRQPMLSISEKGVQEITVMSCIQLMKTELMLNAALYYIHQEPSPIMYVAPKKETAEAWSKERLVKSINATPATSGIFNENRRGEGNTILQKQFPGGQISIVSARNPTDLAMRACMIMLFDECDKYPTNVGAGQEGAGGEGDPIGVAWGRATTYGKRAKKITACSPTIQGKSRIEAEYLKSNQSVFIQPCPHCGHEKTLTWQDVLIPKNDKGKFQHLKAHIVCSDCGVAWTEADRFKSIRNGFWKATKPEVTWHHGYKVSSLASPFTPVSTLAKEFIDALDNPQSMKAFWNTRMAETWKEIGEQPEWKRLYDRRSNYQVGIVPYGGLMLTIGIDVQKDYLVWELVAWGRRNISWSVDHGIIDGKIHDEDTKERLREFLDRTVAVKNAAGINMPVSKICLDSGYATQECYAFVRSYMSDRIVAVKGEKEANLSTLLGTPRPIDVNINGKRITRGLMYWPVGSSVGKEQYYRWLNLESPTDEQLTAGIKHPSGFCHFPQFDEEYFKQMTAEQYVRATDKRGFTTYYWEKLRKDNHLLDCRIYARAGAVMLQIDRMSESDWDELEQRWYPDGIPTVVKETPEQVEVKEHKVVETKPEVLESSKVTERVDKTPRKRKKGWIKR